MENNLAEIIALLNFAVTRLENFVSDNTDDEAAIRAARVKISNITRDIDNVRAYMISRS